MRFLKNTKSIRFALLIAGLFASVATSGCAPFAGFQTTVGGQTLPSPVYLKDDVIFSPKGEEDLIPNQRRALREYRADREHFDN